jgi:hypothetical protein
MDRRLTNAEIQMLRPIFMNTLRYGSIVCKINEANFGGIGNSITPAGVAYFSKSIYCPDFSKANVYDQWVFVHEIAHVWQWGHGTYPVTAAIGIFLQTAGAYANAYPYDLTPGKNLADFNIEQQASVIADYWALVTNKLPPQNNNNKKAALSDYSGVIAQLQKSGPPVSKLDEVPF